MKITHGTAFYTGGGQYSVIGELDNGLWFNGCSEWCAVFDEDTRTKHETEDELACFYNDWCEKHEVKTDIRERYKAFEDFCRRLDAEEEGITDGYDDFNNYIPGEVSRMIDFSYFDERDNR